MNTKQLYNLYAEDLKQFIMDKVKDGMVADDLIQETFIKIHTKLHTLKDKNKVKAWMFSIARYTVMDYFRQKDWVYEWTDEAGGFGEEPIEHTKQDCLRGILKSLPKKYRDPLFLSDIKGLKQAEVSEQLHLPLPTVKSQIQRGRKLIAQGFMDCCDFKISEKGYLVGELKEKEECKVCN